MTDMTHDRPLVEFFLAFDSQTELSKFKVVSMHFVEYYGARGPV
jgi:hypothetical protein